MAVWHCPASTSQCELTCFIACWIIHVRNCPVNTCTDPLRELPRFLVCWIYRFEDFVCHYLHYASELVCLFLYLWE